MPDISRLRDVAVVGPHHSGKTTLVEALLAHCGAINRRGSVHDGTTTTDHEPESIGHAQSTTVGFAHTTCGNLDLNIIDCPGFVDFFEEAKLALLAADAAIVVIDPDPGRVIQTQTLLNFIESRKLPHLFIVNKLDRDGADFLGTLSALRNAYGLHVVPEQVPIGSGPQFSGYVDLVEQKAYAYDADGKEHEIPIDGAVRDAVATHRRELLEALGDFDDHLLEELLEDKEPSHDEVVKDLSDDASHDLVAPVLVASAEKAAGMKALVDAIDRLFPSPATNPRADIDGRAIEPKTDGPIVAQVCKTTVNPQGRMSIARVFTGTLRADSQLVVPARGKTPIRNSGLFRLLGKKQIPVTEAGPGSIVAISRMEGVATGETLVSPGTEVVMPTIPLSEPMYAVAVKPKEKLDEAKVSQSLARLIDEDPSLRVARAEFTNELQLLGSGDVHVTTALERCARKYNLALESKNPTIAYRMTITASTEIHSRYKHQTGGHGQFGDVWLKIEPRPRGHGVTFEEKIVGGVVPRQFFPAVEKGVREALERGVGTPYPVVDLHVTLFDGSYHSVDSSEAAFKTASSMGIRDGLPKCKPVILEPIVRLDAYVPSATASGALSQVTTKRGQVLAFEPSERSGYQHIAAFIPQAELAQYILELRTISQGLGTYQWKHDRFEVVPAKIAEQLTAAAAAATA
ncbi:MAG: elongation factor G [Candidatus Eremiobacteraeota bacterium]|nr:elongation factor G [Candidatus Eremiobacteraeota bacterium]